MSPGLTRRRPPAPAKKRPRVAKPSRDETYRARHREHHQARIEAADTPVDHARAAGDYLVDVIRFVADQDRSWAAVRQISKVIARVAGELSQHVERGGRR